MRRHSLRTRLVVAFVLVTGLGAVAATWASAGSARAALLSEAQQRLTGELTARIGAVAAQVSFPPDQATLDRLRAAVGDNTLVSTVDLQAGAGAERAAEALRTAVRERNRLVWQRVEQDGPRLLIGTPVMITAVDGQRRPSGIEVYAVRDLAGTQAQLDELTMAAARTSAIALPLAVLVALLAAGGVLRPVRRVRDTARRLAAGDLDARLPVRGKDELAELAGTVNEMAGSLQHTVAELRRLEADARRFVADVSHELRTPLSTLAAVSEILQGSSAQLGAAERESAELAVAATQRLVRLVEELMEVSRFDAGMAQLRIEPVEVGGAIRDCLRARGWLDRVRTELPEPVPARLDRRRLDVILANLVGNALRHGGPPVTVTLRAEARRIEIEVTDRGPGLPEAVLPHVFDRFYKADAARSGTEGSGLGLSIARANARLHGGDLTAANRPSGGACFRLVLPREAT
ncbi:MULTISPECIES: HAMP domain-containing sensor histidine kinase [unclassified Crossiella]|uniref:sensor histidine kinase n=1 Tax=unclassified Crossiella TaxID=2620835 RepID=UPI001FFE7422|nr:MULTISPECIES: HAMP domain-containing sensor histidine kinase [unclassified Crossiella]MCK2241598.1 HAMP domain-containing histidine kinase [Crossiella sp. S99.2]MCK2255530.1 HAMP domain-containing histidine kinase [Crossiella sp. S99.1]